MLLAMIEGIVIVINKFAADAHKPVMAEMPDGPLASPAPHRGS
jgi:hypothetical protein